MSELTLTLDGGQTAFTPGEAIHGRASWVLDEPAEALEIRLFWYTQGKGDRDIGGLKTIEIEAAGTRGSRDFEFLAPQQPYSFSGTLISLIWAVELVAMPGGDAARREIVVAPDAREIRIESTEPELDSLMESS